MIISALQQFNSLLKINSPIIGIDYGQKKLGVALSSHNLQMSLPLKTILVDNEQKKIKAILELTLIYQTSGIVIGLPISMDGGENDNSKKVRLFAEKIATKTDLPIFLQDERLSTRGANNLLKSFGLNRKKRHQIDDQIAASLILETTLNAIIRL